MTYMFIGQPNIEELDLSSFNTPNLINIAYMFNDYRDRGSSSFEIINSKIKHIYVGDGWDVSKVTGNAAVFKGCTSLPNFDPNVIDKTKAYVGAGGYLERKN